MQLPKTPSMRLDGKRALVTGASRGIGLGAACALAGAGAHVVMSARSRDELMAAQSAMSQAGYSCEAMVMDVCDVERAQALIEQAGPFDILVNNAGANRPGPMGQMSTDDFDTVMNVRMHHQHLIANGPCRGGRSDRILCQQICN